MMTTTRNVQSRVKRRSQMETFCDVVRVIGAGTRKPTHIMLKANLSWPALQEYLRKLYAQGLVEFQEINEGKKEGI
jgi:predicted transcriptional regulator